MATTLLWGDKLLDLVREEYAAHLIARLRCRKGEHSGNLGNDILLCLLRRAELARTAHVDHQHHCQLALLLINLDMRGA